MNIGVILGGTDLEAQRRNPVFIETIEVLRKRGGDVELIDPRQMSFELSELRIRHDLYVIKSISNPTAATVGATLHALGAPTFNPFPIVQAIRNKIATTRLLAANGVPVPATYVSANAESLVPLLEEGPLIVKPYKGSRGIGVELVRTHEELFLAADGPPVLAQRYHPSDDGLDHKISVIGGDVFGRKRIFTIRVYSDKIGTPLEIDDETREIAGLISKALKIDLFTFDIIVSGGKPYVVDVGSFGSMMGVPDAPRLIADRIVRAWEERETGRE
jgi:ribosomal protein S6--L-glutamate ligase